MNIQDATQKYEKWISSHIRILSRDLRMKHEAMASAPFPFFRATFYRWMQFWPEVCAEVASAPKVLAVGDLHVENFGTWRDVEGRLIWGINDFDEAYSLPYTIDLVRLAASAHLAIDGAHLQISKPDACNCILDGYREGLACGGRPFVLAESHTWLRDIVAGTLRDPVPFWQKIDALKSLREPLPKTARRGLERMMPPRSLSRRVAHRIAGLGSLGRERYVVSSDYEGARIAREAKALAPSACVWAAGKGSSKIRYQEVLDSAVRCVDPFVRLRDRWIIRRLAPDCSRVELTQLPKLRDETRLLVAMGFETANIHLGSRRSIRAVVKDFGKRPKKWLHETSAAMVKVVQKDWEDWRA
jgi:hypothetical protein